MWKEINCIVSSHDDCLLKNAEVIDLCKIKLFTQVSVRTISALYWTFIAEIKTVLKIRFLSLIDWKLHLLTEEEQL